MVGAGEAFYSGEFRNERALEPRRERAPPTPLRCQRSPRRWRPPTPSPNLPAPERRKSSSIGATPQGTRTTTAPRSGAGRRQRFDMAGTTSRPPSGPTPSAAPMPRALQRSRGNSLAFWPVVLDLKRSERGRSRRRRRSCPSARCVGAASHLEKGCRCH